MSAATDFAGFFFKLQHQIRLYHWQTNVYARHQATNGLLESLDGLIDKFMEVYQGKYGKINLGGTKLVIELMSITDEQAVEVLKKSVAYLQMVEQKQMLSANDTELLNIRDEIVGEMQKTLYLFTFH